MDKVKILHFSDVHFDTAFKDMPKDIGEIRRAEIRETFSKAIDLALDENVDIILIAGDLFDNFTIEKSTISFIQNEIRRLENIKIFIAAGNHDPYNEKSFYKMINWGNNVHIFSNEVEYVEIPNLNVVVYGASFKEKYINISQIRDFKIDDKHKDKISLMVLHGTISSSDEGEDYNPITVKNLEGSEIDYVALGHIHMYSGIKRVNNTSFSYSGCIEGRGFDELGEKGAILGYVRKHNVDLDFIPLSKRKYHYEEIDITDSNTNEEIKDKILNHIDINESRDNLYKIILKGQLGEEVRVKEKVLENLLKNYFFYVKIEDRTSIKIDKEKLKDEISLKGLFCSKVLKELACCKDESEKEVLELAFKIGIQSLCEGEVNLDDY